MDAPYVPGVDEANVHDAVDVPPDDSVTLEGHVPVSPEGVETLRLMGPDSPKRLVRVTVLVPEEPVLKDTEVAERLKSMTVAPRDTEWLSEPLVPVIVTV